MGSGCLEPIVHLPVPTPSIFAFRVCCEGNCWELFIRLILRSKFDKQATEGAHWNPIASQSCGRYTKVHWDKNLETNTYRYLVNQFTIIDFFMATKQNYVCAKEGSDRCSDRWKTRRRPRIIMLCGICLGVDHLVNEGFIFWWNRSNLRDLWMLVVDGL